MIIRTLEIKPKKNPVKGSAAVFFWGARTTGKTTLLKQQFKTAKRYDLLDTKLKMELLLAPYKLREEILAQKPKVVIIDEIQKVPELLDEVHWLIENKPITIIMCGSSARKLKREEVNLLGGRAQRYELFPLVTHEIGIDKCNLDVILQKGLLPLNYLDKGDPREQMQAYLTDYLNEEIAKEAQIRNLPAFSRFLKIVALTHGQLLNYNNVASDAGVSAKTVREYYQILKDTLLGHELIPWNKQKERRLIETSKFYLFDVGIANYLRGINPVQYGTDVFGFAFEHFLIEEVRAYLSYKRLPNELYFFRSASGIEVDLIIGDMQVAIEFKGTKNINKNHLKGIRNLKDEFTIGRSIVVSLEDSIRKTDDEIELMHWRRFCKELWNDKIIK